MKKLVLATAISIASIAGSVNAADTQSVPVTAKIQGVCKFTAPIATVAFGLIDPSLTSTLSQNLIFNYRCTNKTQATLTLGTITPMSGTTGNTDTIPFTVAPLPAGVIGSGFGAGVAATNVTIAVTTVPAQYQNARVDDYTGSVVVTISP